MATEADYEKIQNAVCETFKVTREALLSASRLRWIVEARYASMLISRDIVNAIYPEIGASHHRHYSDAIHGVKRARDLCNIDRFYAKKYSEEKWTAQVALKIN